VGTPRSSATSRGSWALEGGEVGAPTPSWPVPLPLSADFVAEEHEPLARDRHDRQPERLAPGVQPRQGHLSGR
jgi:hypothetical protein